MPSRHRLGFVLAALVLFGTVGVSFAAVPVTAQQSDRMACAVCSSALDTTAAHDGYTLTRGHSKMVVDVAENGSTTWTAHVTIVDGVERLENDSYRAELVASTIARGQAVADPTDVSSRLEGDTLVVTYRGQDAVTETHGVLFFTPLHADEPIQPFAAGGEGTVYVGADEFVVRAPPGYAVRGNYGNATTTDDTVRWTGDAAGDSPVKRSTTLAFARENDSLWWPRVTVARALLDA
ncbi:hypothetical protein [Halogeometricum limi]|uniref:Uncharacterized protein n=1 Tax=Halogeometricum limi TaxID=555875 RepID=A0A1I6G1G3_9EURY|nr:hypothetical protein [Halogeometricum limi]SFR36053.1 hypothetical protein SAMN04488124_0717 [Halogeometricum limi]